MENNFINLMNSKCIYDIETKTEVLFCVLNCGCVWNMEDFYSYNGAFGADPDEFIKAIKSKIKDR